MTGHRKEVINEALIIPIICELKLEYIGEKLHTKRRKVEGIGLLRKELEISISMNFD